MSQVRELTFAEAIREALAEEMRRDTRVFILGEDVAEAGTPFKVLSGLVEEFGTERVIDTPISEAGFTGIAVGAAMTGMRPVVDIMFGDFITLTMDQMVNQAAKVHYMSGGKLKVPMVLRTTLGAARRSAAQHSQSLHAWFSHVPGLKVVLPSTPYDAKGLLKAAVRDPDLVPGKGVRALAHHPAEERCERAPGRVGGHHSLRAGPDHRLGRDRRIRRFLGAQRPGRRVGCAARRMARFTSSMIAAGEPGTNPSRLPNSGTLVEAAQLRDGASDTKCNATVRACPDPPT